MAEPIETTEVEPTAAPRPPRGTTHLSRVSGALAWVVGAWFVAYGYPGGYWPLLAAGLLMIWLGAGAWRGRRRRTIALVGLTTIAAAYYPLAAWWFWNHTSGLDGRTRYPRLWATMLAIQSAVLLTSAVTALVSLRRPPTTAAAPPPDQP